MAGTRDIAVVGAGIGGLAVALACAGRGANVQVFEQADELREVGAGIQISPNGMCVLAGLGVADEIAAQTTRSTAIELRDYRQGRLISRFDLQKHGQAAGHFAVHRVDIVEVLYKACLAAGVAFQFGHKAAFTPDDPRIVIAADGVNSSHRIKFLNASEPSFTGQVAWRAVVPNEGAVPAISCVHLAPGRHLVTYPLRQGRLINIVAVQARKTWAASGWSAPDDPAHLRAVFADFTPEVQALLNRVERCFIWGLHRYPVEQKWYRGNLVLLGDAVHPMLPFMAQGANMALEDAWILATCLAHFDHPAEAFAAYQSSRRARVDRVVAASTKNATAFHLAAPARMIAHAALRLGDKIAPGAGIKRLDWLYGYDATKY